MHNTTIFDMDGLLIDSEPVWQLIEQQVFATVGLTLTDAMCAQTTGVRIKDVVAYWYQRYPWTGPSLLQVEQDIIAGMVNHFATHLTIKPGAVELINQFSAVPGHQLAVCSSSPMALIDAALAAMGVADKIAVKYSAEQDEFAKPHPLPYIRCAKRLGVAVQDCRVFEDSTVGAISAKAAGMYVIAVPEGAYSEDKFSFCDQVLSSLNGFRD